MANTLELYANNARTTLSGSLTNVVTSVVLQSGAGALFPSPNNLLGQFAKATIQDAATGLRNEIVYITARTGDILTVLRGQDGTTAQTWSAGDTVFEGVTAATLASFVQPVTVQNCTLVHATAGGTADAITAVYSPAIAALVDGMTVFVKISTTNTTTAPTLAINGLTAKTIVNAIGLPIKIGGLTVGMIAEFKYNATTDKFICQTLSAGGSLIGVQTFKVAGSFSYTPTPGTLYFIVEAEGGGAKGGDTVATGAGQCCNSTGGGGGAYGKGIYYPTNPAATVAVTIGAGGAPGSPNGGTTSFGAYLSVSGGLSPGNASVGTPPNLGTGLGQGGSTIAGANIVAVNGQLGIPGSTPNTSIGGNNPGADSQYGSGGLPVYNTAQNGNNATGNGSGGGGAYTPPSSAARVGGNGAPGIIIVWEYS